MKAICIDASNHHPDAIVIPEGTVVNILNTGIYGTYIVEGYEKCKCGGHNVNYKTRRFIPLSTIDEMELLHNRQTELA